MINTIWPLPTTTSLADRAALWLKRVPGLCNICGRFTRFDTTHDNFREHVACEHCDSRNRQRQMAAVLLSEVLAAGGEPRWRASLADLPVDTRVWIAEASRALQQGLRARLGDNCIATEYIDPALQSGEVRDDVLHVDIQNTHFDDNSLDFILSSDVLEHVPFVDQALRETYRVLKPGGCHIFTAPFYHHRFTTEVRSRMTADGSIEHLRKPWYHDDPLRAEGVLVFNVFAPELLCAIEAVGFEARLLRLFSPLHGIYAQNGIVIVARKTVPPDHARDFIFG